MQFKNQQAIDVLAKLRAGGFPSAIVAGGCVRDEIFGKPVKDIDVFVSYEDYQGSGFGLQKALGRMVAQVGDPEYEDGGDAEVSTVLNLETHRDELPVQVIVLAHGMEPLMRLDKFDFGFCQAAWDGEEVVFTYLFSGDQLDKTITLAHCENQQEYDRSMVRYERLKQKYPEFKLVIPEEYRKYQTPTVSNPLGSFLNALLKVS